MNTATLDTYESLVDYARSISEGIDERRWSLGDVCNVAMERFGEKSIAEIAKDIGQRKSTCYQYSAVSRFYDVDTRNRLRAELPNVTYTYYRDAMRLKKRADAIDWLYEMSEQSVTADEASRRLTERLGRETHDSAEATLFSCAGQIDGKFIIEFSVSEQDYKWLSDVDKVVIRAK